MFHTTPVISALESIKSEVLVHVSGGCKCGKQQQQMVVMPPAPPPPAPTAPPPPAPTDPIQPPAPPPPTSMMMPPPSPRQVFTSVIINGVKTA